MPPLRLGFQIQIPPLIVQILPLESTIHNLRHSPPHQGCVCTSSKDVHLIKTHFEHTLPATRRSGDRVMSFVSFPIRLSARWALQRGTENCRRGNG
ncbi:hypothetical protein D3C80_704580 [compost metagenome]